MVVFGHHAAPVLLFPAGEDLVQQDLGSLVEHIINEAATFAEVVSAGQNISNENSQNPAGLKIHDYVNTMINVENVTHNLAGNGGQSLKIDGEGQKSGPNTNVEGSICRVGISMVRARQLV